MKKTLTIVFAFLICSFLTFIPVFALENTITEPVTGDFVANTAGAYNIFSPNGAINTFAAYPGAIVTIAPTSGTLNLNGKSGNFYTFSAIGKSTSITINSDVVFKYALSYGSSTYSGINVGVGAKLVVNGSVTGSTGNTTGGTKYAIYAYGADADNVSSSIELNGNVSLTVKYSHGLYANMTGIITMKSKTNTPYLLKIDNNSNQHSVRASNGRVELDLVDLQGMSTTNNGMCIFADNNGYVSLLGGDFNQRNKTRPGASAVFTFGNSEVDVKGYEDGSLNIFTGGLSESAIFAFGNSVVRINSDEHIGFVTDIVTGTSGNSQLNGLAAGSLGGGSSNTPTNSQRAGSQFAGSEIIVNGEIHITTNSQYSYGIRVMGDGNSVYFNYLEGQGEQSTIHSAGTAIKFSYADGYSLKYDGVNNDEKAIGGQIVELDHVDLTHDGMGGSNLIQVGGLQSSPTADGYNETIMSGVADAVKNGTLTLMNSVATAQDGRDLLNVTGGKDSSFDYFQSTFTFNVLRESIIIGRISTDMTIGDLSGESSTLNMELDETSEWYLLNDDDNTLGNYAGSNLTELDLKGKVFLNSKKVWDAAFPENNQPQNYGLLSVEKLSGAGEIYLYANMETRKSDKLIITDADGSSGEHKVFIKNDASQTTTESDVLTIIETSGGDGIFYLENLVELGANTYDLQRVNDDWQLYYRSPSTTSDAFYGVLSVNYLMNNIDVQTMQQRMGELRQGYNTGLWGRTYVGNFDSFSYEYLLGLTFDYFGVQFGVDEKKNDFLFGYFGAYAEGRGLKPEEDVMDSHISIKQGNLGAYFTQINDHGIYIDATAKVGAIHDYIRVEDTQNNLVEGNGLSFNLSMNLEMGYKIDLFDTGIYFEPQLQCTYTGQEELKIIATNGLDITRNGYSSLILRGSIVFGYENEGIVPWSLYYRAGLSGELLGKMKVIYNGAPENIYDFKNIVFSNSVGVNVTLWDTSYAYMEIEYDKSDKYVRIQGNLGYRYIF